ncbi:MAG: hypothetical protein WAW37_08180, partial [Syntrophobacteraceae bacterium]
VGAGLIPARTAGSRELSDNCLSGQQPLPRGNGKPQIKNRAEARLAQEDEATGGSIAEKMRYVKQNIAHF